MSRAGPDSVCLRLFDPSHTLSGYRGAVALAGHCAGDRRRLCNTDAGLRGGSVAVSLMRALGRWSYSWYPWHWPALVFAPVSPGRRSGRPATLVVVAVSGGLAVLTLRFVENPLRYAAFLREQLSSPVDQDLLRGLLRGRFVVGAFDEFAVLESSAGADQCHQVGCVDRAPA